MNKKDILIYAITFFVIFLIDFGLLSYLSKTLDQKNYLFYVNTINALPFFASLIGFGTPFAIIYLSSIQPNKAYKFLTESNNLALAVIFTIVIILTPITYLNILPFYILISAILGFFLVIKQNSVNYFLALKKLNSASFVRLNQKLIFLLILLPFISFIIIDNVMIFSIGLIAGELIGFLLLQIKHKIINPEKPTKIKSITKISRYHFLAAVFASLALAIPIFSLNISKIDISQIASFAIALQVLKYFTFILAPFMQLITPTMTPLKNDREKIKNLNLKFLIIIFLLGITAGLLLYFSSESIAKYFFSNEYTFIPQFLEIFSFCIPLIMVNSFSSTVLSSIGGIKHVLTINFIMFLCIITMSLSLFKISIESYALLISGYYLIHFFIVQFYLQKTISNIQPMKSTRLE